MSTLSPIQIAEWFESQARKYGEMAATVRRDFGLKTSQNPRLDNGSSIPTLTFPVVEPSYQAIKDTIGNGKMRAKQIADHLRIPVSIVQGVIDKHPEQFVSGTRGWISVK